VKTCGFIVILVERISITQIDRRVDGHYMKEYIMVLA
jgi:hypothetical protein